MIPSVGEPDNQLLLVAAFGLGIALLIASWRVLVGPSLADRIVALDLIGFILIGIACVVSVISDETAMLGVGLVAALILFLGTAALASYISNKEVRNDDH